MRRIPHQGNQFCEAVHLLLFSKDFKAFLFKRPPVNSFKGSNMPPVVTAAGMVYIEGRCMGWNGLPCLRGRENMPQGTPEGGAVHTTPKSATLGIAIPCWVPPAGASAGGAQAASLQGQQQLGQGPCMRGYEAPAGCQTHPTHSCAGLHLAK